MTYDPKDVKPKDHFREFADRVSRDLADLHRKVEILERAVADVKDMLD